MYQPQYNNATLRFLSSEFTFHKSCRTWSDLLHQDGCLGGQSEAMRVEAWVPLDLDNEAEGVIPLIGATGLCCLPIHCNPISGEQEDINKKQK